ncbi:MAG: ribbon-helix-helix domain-containing protein [Sulfolobales archaeon]
MRIITVKIPETYLEGLEELVNIGRYTSRSEAIRAAIRDLLKKELWEMSSNPASDHDHGGEPEENMGINKRLDRSSRVVRLTL